MELGKLKHEKSSFDKEQTLEEITDNVIGKTFSLSYVKQQIKEAKPN